ncbi:FIMAH domain-containing protein [Peribacillus frigoritolerans]|uniref:FIMAH domain-containing protein n=1 Tax=Peribacillus frigoritolerans TaxID=450367 RepID=UPI00399C903E
MDTVVHFEKLEADKRIVKHIKRFKKLLGKHKKVGLISKDAYNTLKTCTDPLIKKWQKDCKKDLGYQVDVE